MPEIVYKCSYCGNECSSYMDARWCEILHTRCPQEEKDRIFREELLAAKQNPCLFCARVILSTARNFAVKTLIVGIIKAF